MWYPIHASAHTVVLLKADAQNNLPSRTEVSEFFEACAEFVESGGQAQLKDVVATYHLGGRRMSIRFQFMRDRQQYEIWGQLVAPDVFSSRQEVGFVPTWISAETIDNVQLPNAKVKRILAALKALLRAGAADAAHRAGLLGNIPA